MRMRRKLLPSQVADIRLRWLNGERQEDLAEEFQVSQSTISSVVAYAADLLEEERTQAVIDEYNYEQELRS